MITIVDDRVATGDWFIRRFGVSKRLVARPGQREPLVRHLLDAGEHLAKAPGCYMYLVSVSAVDADTVWITEAWRSKDHREAALDRPDARRMRSQAETMVMSMDEPIFTIPVGGKGLLAR